MVSTCFLSVAFPSKPLFQRAIYAECNGSEKYWNLIDARLEFIRSVANKSASKQARCAILIVSSSSADYIYVFHRAFTELLKQDRAKYGAGDDYEITDSIADEWQQRVDNVVGGLIVGTEDVVTP